MSDTETSTHTRAPAQMTSRAASRAKWIAVGALSGLTWATGFRAYMSELAGYSSRFDWMGTFAAILLPGLLVGAMYGWAGAMVHEGRARGFRWTRFATVLFVIMPMLRPGALTDLFTRGLGGGAVGVALIAIAGGFAFGHVGPRWARISAGVFAFAAVGAVAFSVPLIGGRRLAVGDPRGVWVMLLAACFVIVLMLASSIAWRRPPLPSG